MNTPNDDNLNMTVIDAGARYGLHPTWEPLKDLVEFHLFETDDAEVARLENKYRQSKNINVNNVALYSEDTQLTFKSRNHRALNSIYTVNEDFLSQENYMHVEHEDVGEYEVTARTIDSLFPNLDIHFLKLDTEGAELEILRGSLGQLSGSILGVRAEVPFAPILDGAPTFGEINSFMFDQGYELINLDYDGKGRALSPFTNGDRYGKLMSTDAVWTISPHTLFNSDRPEIAKDVIRMALFLMLNSATDIALHILLEAVQKHNISILSFTGTPLHTFLHRQVALLFKNISYIPSMEMKLLQDSYFALFNEEYPLNHKFFESKLFS